MSVPILLALGNVRNCLARKTGFSQTSIANFKRTNEKILPARWLIVDDTLSWLQLLSNEARQSNDVEVAREAIETFKVLVEQNPGLTQYDWVTHWQVDDWSNETDDNDYWEDSAQS
jgi:hypothetical protein